jgi:hypothetical protein
MSAPKSESVMLCLKYWDSSSPAVARMQQATAKANAAPQPLTFVVLLSCPGAYALRNAGELSRPGRGWPSSTCTEFSHAEGQKDQDRYLPSA